MAPNRRWKEIAAIGNETEARFPDRSDAIPTAYERRLASIDLNRAVADGRIVKPTKCEECGKQTGSGALDGLHGHHRDYKKPLEVQWLCRKCHMNKHRQYYGSVA